jgi:hypothetical protein
MNASASQPHMKAECKANGITLRDPIAMGAGVMIGAGIFALTGAHGPTGSGSSVRLCRRAHQEKGSICG